MSLLLAVAPSNVVATTYAYAGWYPANDKLGVRGYIQQSTGTVSAFQASWIGLCSTQCSNHDLADGG